MKAMIRPAVVTDAAVLAALAERTFRETYTAHNSAEDMASYVSAHFGTARQAAELRDAAVRTLLAHVDDHLAAYVQLRSGPAPECVPGAAPVEVVRFYVDRPWQGRGLADQLMDAAVDAARAADAGVLWLGVWERNPRAIAFYRRSGFVDVGTQIFVLGADRQRDRVLARLLT
jgi:diamine N-acetyltransferase